MAFLDEAQLATMQITRMIFHVVSSEAEPRLLEEMNPGEHAEFFLDRIKSTNSGIMFDFVEGSSLLTSLQTVSGDRSRFVEITKVLAGLFQLGHSGSTIPGAFFVFVLTAGEETLFAIIKYDHEQVLSYVIENTAAGERALMAALQNTFNKSPEALQKSAIIRLTDTGGELCVRDRSAPTKISRYFQQFLGARRRFDSGHLTFKLHEITKKVAKKNFNLLGPIVMRSLNQKVYEAIQHLTGFDPSNREPFLAAVFGPLPEDSKVRGDFERALKTERIESEAFEFERSVIRRPSKRHIITDEGIEVIWDNQYEEAVKKYPIEGDRTRIVIETGGIRVDDDYAEPRSRTR